MGSAGAWVGMAIVALGATGVLLARDWRWQLGLMTFQYAGTAVLVNAHWPIGMAAAVLVTGWMSTAAMAMTFTSVPLREEPQDRSWPEGRAFRLFMAGMILVLAFGLASQNSSLLTGIETPVLAGATVLAGIGALQLGSSPKTAHTILGLLTVISGFEIYYAAVEGSILVAGLLSMVVLGLGLTGAYLLGAHLPEDSE